MWIRLMSRWQIKSIQSQRQSKHTLPNTHRITFTKDKRLSIFCLSWDTLFTTSCVLLWKKIAPSGNKCGNIFSPFPLILILLSCIGWLARGTLQRSNSHSPTHESLSCRCSLPGRPTQDTKLDYNKSDWHLIYSLAPTPPHTHTHTHTHADIAAVGGGWRVVKWNLYGVNGQISLLPSPFRDSSARQWNPISSLSVLKPPVMIAVGSSVYLESWKKLWISASGSSRS